MDKFARKTAFLRKYKTLGGYLAGDFYDSLGGGTDLEIARRIRDDLGSTPRELSTLVDDCARLLGAIDDEWEVLADTANRPFENANEARAWISPILMVWEKTLRDIDGRRPS